MIHWGYWNDIELVDLCTDLFGTLFDLDLDLAGLLGLICVTFLDIYLVSFDFDFGIAHGFFDKNDFYNKAPLLHEKFLYMNIRKNNYLVSIGFVHEAMWGGSTVAKGDQPNTFKDFLKVLIS